jgi:PAS domain S-box-containing protein
MADRVSTEPDMGLQTPCTNEQEWLRVILTSIGDAVLACDIHGHITYLNPMAVSLTGWEPEEAHGLSIHDVFRIINDETGAPADNIVARVLKHGQRVELANHTALITKDGRTVPIEDSAAPIRDIAGSVVGVVLVFHDVSERKQKEKELQQVNRTLRALTKVNQAMLHAADEVMLLQQVCDIINKDCGYAMVWTGFAEKDAEKTVRPIAHAGVEEAYLKTVRITWAEDSESGRGPAGIAIRTRKPYCCRNLSTDPEFAPWRAEAQKRGYESVLVLPLANGEKVFGALIIYSNQANSFPDEERNLMEELASHLAYGINALRVRAAHEDVAEALRESEAQLRFALKANRAGMWTVDLVTGHRDLSPELQQLYGFLPGEFDGTQEGSTNPVIPEDRARVGGAMLAAMHSGEFEVDFRYRSVGSEAIHWMQARGRVIHDALDRPIRMIGVNTEITERKRYEARLRRFFETDLFAILYWKIDGGVIDVNDKFLEMTGYTREDLRAGHINWAKITPPEYQAMDDDARHQILETGVHQPYEKEYIRKDGTRVWGFFAAAAWEDNRHEGVSFIIDITERKRAENALLRSEKLATVGRMAATIAHEINNPLAAVTNSLFLAKNMDNMSAAREYLDIADEELRRITHITRQSLGFYRESNAPALTSISAVLDSTLELLKSKIKAKHAVIEKRWDGELSINAVAGELRQVFSNFVSNSLDALESHGAIKLRLSNHTTLHNGRRCIRVTIADNGKGISASSLSHIFEPFYTTKGAVGTGLGLWVSKQIVDKHAGKIRVRSSTREGQSGTVISVVLPFETEEEPLNQSAHA